LNIKACDICNHSSYSHLFFSFLVLRTICPVSEYPVSKSQVCHVGYGQVDVGPTGGAIPFKRLQQDFDRYSVSLGIIVAVAAAFVQQFYDMFSEIATHHGSHRIS
jgi:hypothetical protein